MDRFGNRPVESSAWIERMIWRTVCMALFVLGIVCMTVDSEDWLIYVPLVAGGLGPGLFLMAREQHERQIEAARAEFAPEHRTGALPPLRGADVEPVYGPPADPRDGMTSPYGSPDSGEGWPEPRRVEPTVSQSYATPPADDDAWR